MSSARLQPCSRAELTIALPPFLAAPSSTPYLKPRLPILLAPYERCQYGRVRHFVVAKARGLGNLGGDIHSNEKELFLIVNPGASMSTSAPPPPLHYKMEGLDDALGPWTAALQSQHVMIGGLLLFRINILSVPTDLAIHTIRVKVLQHFTLKSPPGEDPPYVEQPPPDARTVFLLDLHHPPNMGHILTSTSGTRSGSQTPRSGPLAVLSPGEGYKAHHLVRLLNDNIIRSSTQPGTEASINVRHDVVVEIIYQELQDETESASRSRDRSKGKGKEGKEKEKERKMFTISKPLEIFSVRFFCSSLAPSFGAGELIQILALFLPPSITLNDSNMHLFTPLPPFTYAHRSLSAVAGSTLSHCPRMRSKILIPCAQKARFRACAASQ